MTDDSASTPDCYGHLETVFPMGNDGLRHSPDICLKCHLKTSCLKTALKGPEGLIVEEEVLDRSYKSGITGFWERWSRKKTLHRRKKRYSK